MAAFKLGLVGLGKIAQDQHLPVIAANPAFNLLVVASQRGLTAPGARTVATLDEMLAAEPDLDAVVICTPPQARHALALRALQSGKHVMLEKPPTATLSELDDLRNVSRRQSRVLYTTWHSQYNAAVEEAGRRLAGQQVTELFVDWKEDVRKWHPGQAWIWKAGGFGVFDPGINALSIVTRIMPQPLFIATSELSFPSNADAPIAARLTFASDGLQRDALRAEFDWRQTGGEVWEITLKTAAGTTLKLGSGGTSLSLDGTQVTQEPSAEYEKIYQHFERLLADKVSHIDESPLRLVADAFLLGRRVIVEEFHD